MSANDNMAKIAYEDFQECKVQSREKAAYLAFSKVAEGDSPIAPKLTPTANPSENGDKCDAINHTAYICKLVI
jgi:hypothetical protein